MNLRGSGKDLSMYTPHDSSSSKLLHQQQEGPAIVDPRKSKSTHKHSSIVNARRVPTSVPQRSKTPVRDSCRTIDPNERRLGNTENRRRGMEANESDLRLNKLIQDYRQENERCTYKINELKQRLSDPMEGHGSPNKIYAKSYKVTADSRFSSCAHK